MNSKRTFPKVQDIYPDIHSIKIREYFKSKHQATSDKRALGCEISRKLVYIICFTNRCGSNMVAQSLATTGILRQAGENLNFDAVINHSERLNITAFAEYWQWLTGNAGKSGIFGCKASVGQLIHLWESNILTNMAERLRIIHVVRDDLIGQAVSLYIASKTRRWTSEQVGIPADIVYSSAELVRIARSIALQNSMFKLLFQLFSLEYLTVRYEDFVTDPASWVRRIGNFVGIDGLNFNESLLRYTKQADRLNEEFKERLLAEFVVSQ